MERALSLGSLYQLPLEQLFGLSGWKQGPSEHRTGFLLPRSPSCLELGSRPWDHQPFLCSQASEAGGVSVTWLLAGSHCLHRFPAVCPAHWLILSPCEHHRPFMTLPLNTLYFGKSRQQQCSRSRKNRVIETQRKVKNELESW